MMLPKVQDKQVKGKKVLLRLDTDVEVENGKVVDAIRLEAGFETIKYLLNNGATVIIVGHLGRPLPELTIEGITQSISEANKKYSLLPVAKWYEQHIKDSRFKLKEAKIDGFTGWQLAANFFILENIRYYKGEEEMDKEFVQKLADIADVYVNDAFAVSHRNHASMVGVVKLLPHAAGLHLQKEISVLEGVLKSPKRPLTVLIGGAKIETKLPLVEKMHKVADYVLVGGKIAQETRTLLKVQHEKLEGRKSALLVADLLPSGLDITQNSVENFLQIITESKTVVWNGPMGLTQSLKDRNREDTEKGTRELAEGITNTNLYSVLGGGDTISYLDAIGLLSKFSFVSSGGGAMLAFLSGDKLPALEALSQ